MAYRAVSNYSCNDYSKLPSDCALLLWELAGHEGRAIAESLPGGPHASDLFVSVLRAGRGHKARDSSFIALFCR